MPELSITNAAPIDHTQISDGDLIPLVDVSAEPGSKGSHITFAELLLAMSGADGLSAYQIAVNNGFSGDQGAWLASLVGAAGSQGIQGDQGPQGIQGETGPQGSQGPAGSDASMQGPQGIQGETGPQGIQGETGETGETGAQGPQGMTGEVTNFALDAAISGTSSNSNGVELLSLTATYPPTLSEVQSIADKLDALITALRR